MSRRYSDLISIPTFEERYEYCRLNGSVGVDTFGFDRYMNQMFYTSKEWREFRRQILIRDNGLDLAFSGRPIIGKIFVHHLNPLTPDQLKHGGSNLFDPENFVCVSFDTHQAIHYGDRSLLQPSDLVIRRPNDTIPWRN